MSAPDPGTVAQAPHVTSVRTTDGVVLHARTWPTAGEPRAAIVLAHGFTAHTAEPAVVATAVTLSSAGFDVVGYDARGHGSSGGASTLGDAEEHDVAAAVDLARTRSDRVVLVGASMGAIAVLRYASHTAGLAGVVAISSPARWALPRTPKAVAAALLTRTPPGRALAARLMGVRVAPRWTAPAPPVELVRTIDAPIVIVHGANDTFIPVAAAFELHREAGTPRRLMIVDGMGHAFSDSTAAPVAEAVAWTLAGGPSLD